MKAPDKIYIAETPNKFIEIWSDESPEPKPYITEHEYIRKDALMDYFHQRVEDLGSPLNGVFGSTERDNCNERISELLLLIDKLNEM